MDPKKLAVLRSLPYRILPTCGLCLNADIRRGEAFGTCQRHSYEHVKHRELRQLSIHRSGTCPDFSWDQMQVRDLERFSELVSNQKKES